MRTVSVLTCVHPGRAEFLADAWQSLAVQVLPAGWEFEWVVIEDGPHPTLRDWVVGLDDPRVRYLCTGAHVGYRAARNVGLFAAVGVVVCILDADDLLPTGSLLSRLTAWDQGPSDGWVVSSASVLCEDGSTEMYDRVLEPRVWEPNETIPVCRSEGHVPVVPNTLVAPTWLLVALGGWPAVPSVDDEALVACVMATRAGTVIADDTYWWREWDKNTSNGEAFDVRVERDRVDYFTRVTALTRFVDGSGGHGAHEDGLGDGDG